jgi:hypothetical protein
LVKLTAAQFPRLLSFTKPTLAAAGRFSDHMERVQAGYASDLLSAYYVRDATTFNDTADEALF